jgi:hypothetical protein
MRLASELALGIASLFIAAGLVWFGKPNAKGANPAFLQIPVMQMIYPAIILVFIAFGCAALLSGLR